MPSAFETAHADESAGTLTTVDRMIVHGHLRGFYFGGGMGLLLGEHTIGGLRNRDLEANLYHTPEQRRTTVCAHPSDEARSDCSLTPRVQ